MKVRIPVLLFSALALAAPGAMAHGNAKDNDKEKNTAKQERKANKDNKNKPGQNVPQNADHDRDDDDRDDRDDRNARMTICHVPPGNPGARHTITIGSAAWPAHQGHGDHRGRCRNTANRNTVRDRFNALDRNNDGVISPNEWPHGQKSFDRLDRNNDRVIGRNEWRNQVADANLFSDWERDFRHLDHNRDGRITPREWHADRASFNRFDLNNDGVITREEFRRRS